MFAVGGTAAITEDAVPTMVIICRFGTSMATIGVITATSGVSMAVSDISGEVVSHMEALAMAGDTATATTDDHLGWAARLIGRAISLWFY
jgi:hypothetical protein